MVCAGCCLRAPARGSIPGVVELLFDQALVNWYYPDQNG